MDVSPFVSNKARIDDRIIRYPQCRTTHGRAQRFITGKLPQIELLRFDQPGKSGLSAHPCKFQDWTKIAPSFNRLTGMSSNRSRWQCTIHVATCKLLLLPLYNGSSVFQHDRITSITGCWCPTHEHVTSAKQDDFTLRDADNVDEAARLFLASELFQSPLQHLSLVVTTIIGRPKDRNIGQAAPPQVPWW